MNGKNTSNWIKHVMKTSFATNPPIGIFTKKADEITKVMSSKKVSPKGLPSALRMIQFHINRGGSKLTNRIELEKAKKIIQNKIQQEK